MARQKKDSPEQQLLKEAEALQRRDLDDQINKILAKRGKKKVDHIEIVIRKEFPHLLERALERIEDEKREGERDNDPPRSAGFPAITIPPINLSAPPIVW